MEQYKPNSRKSKEDRLVPVSADPAREKKVEKVISGSAKPKKKNKFTDVLISEDVNNVKSYILMDVLIPAVKKAISDIITNGIDMLLYGEAGRNKKNSNASKVSYRSYYENDRGRELTLPHGGRNSYNYDEITINNRGDAEEVLSRMDELISTYGLVSVADLYDLVGMTGNYTDNKYGWTDIRSASVVRVRDGYLLKLPKALPLD